jgi:hypothetical protein
MSTSPRQASWRRWCISNSGLESIWVKVSDDEEWFPSRHISPDPGIVGSPLFCSVHLFGPLGLASDRDAGDPLEEGFFLDSSRVGGDDGCD